jgi:hypothetical protein
MPLTKPQLGRLQVLYSQLAAREIGVETDRQSRLNWASERLHKQISSFKDLSGADAGFLIDSLQGELGVKAPARPRKRLDRAQARRAGLDGRKDGGEFTAASQMATSGDLARIEALLYDLGWDQAGLMRFLDSPRSPFKRRADKAIRTTSDANQVWWALKNIARQKGVWRKKP